MTEQVNVEQTTEVSQEEQEMTEKVDTSEQEEALTQAQLRIETLEKEVASHYEKLLRANAELENTRRRAKEEVEKTHKYASEKFAKELLAVKDSLEAALGQQDQTLEALLEGVQTTLKQLNSVFERHKVLEIAPQVGDVFDPNVHQAISTIPSSEPVNHIAQVLQKGSLMADRVLRPALVMVSSGQ